MRLLKKRSNKKLVLLVDDTNVMRKLITGILGRDYEVHACNSGLEAISWLSESKRTPDVVVTDTAMNEMSGIELAQYLSINGLYGQIPLIFMSDRSEDELRSELNSVNYNGYAKKPFSPDKLLDAISRVA